MVDLERADEEEDENLERNSSQPQSDETEVATYFNERIQGTY